MLDNASYNDFVERVDSSSDILKVISSYVQLRRRGHNYWGCCPFHKEKTPSFSVVPDEGFFYCFGCHKGGNVFKFISLIENVSYGEAIRLQAERLNIPLPQKNRSEAQIKKDQKIKSLYKIYKLAQTFFYNCLTKTNYGKPGLTYLKKRGINKQIIERFHLGFAPPGWDKLTTAFAKRGISEEVLLQTGLIVKKKTNGCYDRFRERVIIPIADEKGRIVGFGARTLGSDQPKYLNSPETVLFNKRRLLFGLSEAGKFIRQKDFAIIVEGYMDAIALASSGVDNAVASLGTAFTEQQCKKLLHYSPNIYFCYDSDNAGQTATVRALSIARGSGAEVKVILLPDGKDPDEFVRRHGAKAFDALIGKALNFIDFHLFHITQTVDCTTLEGKLKAVNFMLPVLSSINNLVEVNGYIIRIAQTLGIDETDLRLELRKYQQGKPIHDFIPSSMKRTAADRDPLLKAGRYIINKIWREPDILDYVLANVAADEFSDKAHREILSFIAGKADAKEKIDDMTAAQSLSDEAYAELSRCIITNKNAAEDNLLDDYLKKIHLAYLKKSYHEHSMKADELERKGDDGFEQELREIQRIIKEMDEIN